MSGHHHHHGHDHAHVHEHRDIRPLRIAMLLTGTVFIAQVVGGFISGSLALLSDAGHVFVDLASLVIAFAGLRIAARAREKNDIRFTFGMRRIEILAALTNGFLLLGICVYIIIEAVRRFASPEHVHADSMLVIAIVGFVANGISALYLHRSEHITTRSAYLHVMTDLLSSAGVIIAAIILSVTDWQWIDPLISLLIAAVIIRGAVRVIKNASVILMESAPEHISPEQVRTALLSEANVINVHDVHVWQLGSKDYTATVHVVSEHPSDEVVLTVQSVMKRQFDIDHTTVQVESPGFDHACGNCEERST
ncbi:MAG: cation transporter [Bacteroidetes bacterium]|nr:cation transporter [Bacteroidota bacterium]